MRVACRPSPIAVDVSACSLHMPSSAFARLGLLHPHLHPPAVLQAAPPAGDGAMVRRQVG